jgi:hypothetical protein
MNEEQEQEQEEVLYEINYKSNVEIDSAFFYCPYVPLSVHGAVLPGPRKCYE